ncbi:hypothetical protein PHLGIDRAFT_249235 [Phlebiopsis gigantea 11061_1 CR5-6]|uniref:Uncharacterized protein n=1 Tax=Phlebiopsis gigantea (strain 11061_1 CR5-6) TaxID=745531 RepID=A0A0C3SE79_PHLG1|nr:hypothetical protein PHLGIDRAFT_249235 [Phlebiopsis gigantea 11061_1 CR5-6]
MQPTASYAQRRNKEVSVKKDPSAKTRLTAKLPKKKTLFITKPRRISPSRPNPTRQDMQQYPPEISGGRRLFDSLTGLEKDVEESSSTRSFVTLHSLRAYLGTPRHGWVRRDDFAHVEGDMEVYRRDTPLQQGPGDNAVQTLVIVSRQNCLFLDRFKPGGHTALVTPSPWAKVATLYGRMIVFQLEGNLLLNAFYRGCYVLQDDQNMLEQLDWDIISQERTQGIRDLWRKIRAQNSQPGCLMDLAIPQHWKFSPVFTLQNQSFDKDFSNFMNRFDIDNLRPPAEIYAERNGPNKAKHRTPKKKAMASSLLSKALSH